MMGPGSSSVDQLSHGAQHSQGPSLEPSTPQGVVKVKWDNKNMEKHVNYSQNSQLLVIFLSPSLFFLSPQQIFFLIISGFEPIS